MLDFFSCWISRQISHEYFNVLVEPEWEERGGGTQSVVIYLTSHQHMVWGFGLEVILASQKGKKKSTHYTSSLMEVESIIFAVLTRNNSEVSIQKKKLFWHWILHRASHIQQSTVFCGLSAAQVLKLFTVIKCPHMNSTKVPQQIKGNYVFLCWLWDGQVADDAWHILLCSYWIAGNSGDTLP